MEDVKSKAVTAHPLCKAIREIPKAGKATQHGKRTYISTQRIKEAPVDWLVSIVLTKIQNRTKVAAPKLSPLVRQIAPQADQVFRDQYVLEFLGGKNYESEHAMKKALIGQMKHFVLELGKDFLFVDEEYRLQVGNSDFRIDLLFYHRELQCLVAFELKMGKFKPEHLGQLNFYLEAQRLFGYITHMKIPQKGSIKCLIISYSFSSRYGANPTVKSYTPCTITIITYPHFFHL